MIKIEIAGYPKSGNTWLIALTRNYLEHNLNTPKYRLPEIINKTQLNEHYDKTFTTKDGNEYLIYKNHIINSNLLNPDFIIHIYRHPLDVFLSNRNYFYYRKDNYKQSRLDKLFIKGIPKTVDDCYKDGELDYYFNEFMEKAGTNYWKGMLGTKSNYFTYNLGAFHLTNSLHIKYEDLIDDADKSVRSTLDQIFQIKSRKPIDTEFVNSGTKNSANKGFYWKAKKNNYKDYLTEDQIRSFYEKYDKEMIQLKYF